jgi:FKBP-type peptidyl-prolyl cis-trans isomerase
LLFGSVACHDEDSDAPADDVVAAERSRAMVARQASAQVKASDTVLVHYTGLRQRTGETFFTTRARGVSACSGRAVVTPARACKRPS